MALLAAAVAFWRGPRWISLGYQDLASRALARAWPSGVGATFESSLPRSRAASLLQSALCWDPQNERARLEAGRVAGLQDGCEAALQVWSDHAPQDEIALLERANALHACGRAEEALTLYQQIPQSAVYLGFLAAQAQQPALAIQRYQLSLAISPTLQVAEALTLIYHDANQPEMERTVWVDLSAATTSGDPDHWWALGQAAALQQDWDGAAAAYAAGAALARGPCRFWEAQCDSLRRLERWQEAEDVCQSALRSCPDQVWPYLRMGDVRRAQSDLDGALEWYRQAATLRPDAGQSQYLIGLTLYRQGLYVQAEQALRQALSLDADHAASAYYLARCLYETGRMGEAAETLAAAIELEQGPAWEWALLLGDWRLKLGDREGALHAYLRAQAWAPQEEKVRGRIQRLQTDHP